MEKKTVNVLNSVASEGTEQIKKEKEKKNLKGSGKLLAD